MTDHTPMRPFDAVMERAHAYGSHAWETASGHAWDSLMSCASDFTRGLLTWEEACARVDGLSRAVDRAHAAEPVD